eukprot:s3798_g2.t1
MVLAAGYPLLGGSVRGRKPGCFAHPPRRENTVATTSADLPWGRYSRICVPLDWEPREHAMTSLGGKKPGNGMNIRQWECLKHAIHQIHEHNASSLSFEELYRNAYNLVLHKYGELLYNGVQSVVADHLKIVAQSCVDCPDDRLLEELKKQWDDHKTTMAGSFGPAEARPVSASASGP